MQDCINVPYEEKDLSKKTCKNVRGAITAFYACMVKNRIAMEEPKKLTVPDRAPVGERTILQPNGLQTVFSVDTVTIRGKLQKAFFIHCWRLILLSGMRRGEAAGLQPDDIDTERGIVRIMRSINSKMEITKGKKAMRCAITN